MVVAPHVGAWVETDVQAKKDSNPMSLPVWERGLKHFDGHDTAIFALSLPMRERGLKRVR